MFRQFPAFKTYKDAYTRKILAEVKNDFLNHLRQMRDQLNLSAEVLKNCNDFLDNQFEKFYADYIAIIISLDESDLRDFIHLNSNAKFKKLFKIYNDLNDIGYHYVNGRKINFWCGKQAKEKVKMSEGFYDETIPVIEVFFHLIKLVRAIEHTQYQFNGHYLEQRLVEINFSMFAAAARGNIDIYLSSDKTLEPAGLIAGNCFWNYELPILQHLHQKGLVNKITMHVLNKNHWDSFEFEKAKLPIYRRIAYYNDEKPERFQTPLRMFANSNEFKQWSQTEARPASSTIILNNLKNTFINKMRIHQKEIKNDTTMLLALDEKNVAKTHLILNTNVGKSTLATLKLLEGTGPWGVYYRILVDFNLIDFPTYLNTKTMKAVIQNMQHGNNMFNALKLLKNADYLDETSIHLILKKPEKATAVAKAYIDIMKKFSSRGYRWVSEYAEDILLTHPQYAADAIFAWYHFNDSTLTMREEMRQALLNEDIIIQANIFIEICFNLSQSGLYIFNLLTKNNIQKLITHAHYLSELLPLIKSASENHTLTQPILNKLFHMCAHGLPPKLPSINHSDIDTICSDTNSMFIGL